MLKFLTDLELSIQQGFEAPNLGGSWSDNPGGARVVGGVRRCEEGWA